MVEQEFATLYYQMIAMMAHTGPHGNLNTGIWTECAVTATKLKNIMVNPQEDKCAHEKFYGKITEHTKYLSTFWRNGSCTQYFRHKSKTGRSTENVHVPSL